MKRYVSLVLIAAGLAALSAALYLVHYAIFGDVNHIVSYILIDLAFVPIEVLLVGVIVERLLARHARQQLLHKMNMVIGTFFSELGTGLLGDLTASMENRAEIASALGVRGDWKAADFRQALERAADMEYRIDPARLDLAGVKARLVAKRDMLVMLLANPNLLEHERFTDLLWAVFHLMEELAARPGLEGLPPSDREHLAGDVRRVYGQLAREWLRHAWHLQKAYPYIFSVVVRTHPLQEDPSAVVR